VSALSSEQLRLVLLLGTLVGVILAAVFSGLGFLIKRRMTGAAKQERMSYLATVADLAAKARSAGMTVDEVAALERALLSPSTSGSTAAITAVAASTSQTLNPRYANNVAMKARAHAALDVATAQMEQSYLPTRTRTCSWNRRSRLGRITFPESCQPQVHSIRAALMRLWQAPWLASQRQSDEPKS